MILTTNAFADNLTREPAPGGGCGTSEVSLSVSTTSPPLQLLAIGSTASTFRPVNHMVITFSYCYYPGNIFFYLDPPDLATIQSANGNYVSYTSSGYHLEIRYLGNGNYSYYVYTVALRP